jgi:hypothetical protein
VDLGVVPPRVRSLIERIQRSGGAAKPGRFGWATGGVGMVFAVHPNVSVLKKIIGSASFSLVYDASRRRFITAPQDTDENHPKPLQAIGVRLRQTSITVQP